MEGFVLRPDVPLYAEEDTFDPAAEAEKQGVELDATLKDVVSYVKQHGAFSDTQSFAALRQRVLRAFCIEDMEVDTVTNSGVMSWLAVLFGSVAATRADAVTQYENARLLAKREIRTALRRGAASSRVTEAMVDEELAYEEVTGKRNELVRLRTLSQDCEALEKALKIMVDAVNQKGYALRAMNYRCQDTL